MKTTNKEKRAWQIWLSISIIAFIVFIFMSTNGGIHNLGLTFGLIFSTLSLSFAIYTKVFWKDRNDEKIKELRLKFQRINNLFIEKGFTRNASVPSNYIAREFHWIKDGVDVVCVFSDNLDVLESYILSKYLYTLDGEKYSVVVSKSNLEYPAYSFLEKATFEQIYNNLLAEVNERNQMLTKSPRLVSRRIQREVEMMEKELKEKEMMEKEYELDEKNNEMMEKELKEKEMMEKEYYGLDDNT